MQVARYDPELTLREARALYFEINNFKAGGYEDRWVKMKAGPFPIAFPNTQARVRAVKFHDLHHVLTEYNTTWRGEAEIGAWEVATGCAHHYPAWILNLLAFAIGLVINPSGVHRAFLRGRQSSNLYRRTFNDQLLAHKVGDMRAELGLNEHQKPATRADEVSFAAWASISVFTYFVTGVITLAPLILLALLVLLVLLVLYVAHIL
jgi:hypothetical protein